MFCAPISVPSSCTAGNLTLVDGDSEMEGRVEVCRGGVWGAVYDYSGWNFNDAQVTCRQLGYPSECELVSTCGYRHIYQLHLFLKFTHHLCTFSLIL